MQKYLTIHTLVILVAITLSFSTPALSSQPNNIILQFADPSGTTISDTWKIKKFKGLTQYALLEDDEKNIIIATSNKTASGLVCKVDYSLNDYPILTWQWKIQNILSKGDATKKAGDDYAARIYVIFPSAFFWRTKAITYIWANKLPQGEMIANPFTSNDIMIAVESGEKYVGQWVTEKRNIYEDYIKAFGHTPPQVGGIAIMTDSDNTGQETRAWYGPITIMKE